MAGLTLSDMITSLQDRLGVTAEEALLVRICNQAKDHYQTANKWPHLETTTNAVTGNSTRLYAFGTDVGEVLALHNSAGTEVEQVHRDTYNALYRPSGSAANQPLVFVKQGYNSTGGPQIHVWPTPNSTTTGTLHYIRSIPDLASASSTSRYQNIPERHDVLVRDIAEAKFREYENRLDSAQVLWARIERMMLSIIGRGPTEAPHDGT